MNKEEFSQLFPNVRLYCEGHEVYATWRGWKFFLTDPEHECLDYSAEIKYIKIYNDYEKFAYRSFAALYLEDIEEINVPEYPKWNYQIIEHVRWGEKTIIVIGVNYIFVGDSHEEFNIVSYDIHDIIKALKILVKAVRYINENNIPLNDIFYKVEELKSIQIWGGNNE